MARSRSKGNEVFDMLKEDHDKVKQSLKEFEKLDRGDAEACRQLIEATCEDLKVHTTLEEELLNEAAVEHETAKMLIEQIENMSADDPNYHATFTVLGEYVQHHIKEEEGELFPAAAKCGLDFGSLAERMRSRKEELVGET